MKEKVDKRWMAGFFTLVFIIGSYSVIAATTVPEGPGTFTVEDSTRRTPAEEQSLDAVAGNVTQLTIDGETVTQTWFGVFGNITGTITLDNGNNLTMYDWSVSDPAGEVYATTATTVYWSELSCWDIASVDTENYFTLTELETSLGLGSSDDDGVDETFSGASPHDAFYVGNISIAADSCPATSMYNSSQIQDSNLFQEVLLYNGQAGTDDREIIYTGIIEDTAVNGFDSTDMDFQMLLGENGHNGDTDSTTYYFYVEIE